MAVSLIPVYKDKKHASCGVMITPEQNMDSAPN